MKVSIVIVNQENDGTPLPPKFFADLEKNLSLKFGGFTKQNATGGYVMPNKSVVYDASTIYYVLVSDKYEPKKERKVLKAIEFMKTTAEYVKKHFKQNSVLLMLNDDAVFV